MKTAEKKHRCIGLVLASLILTEPYVFAWDGGHSSWEAQKGTSHRFDSKSGGDSFDISHKDSMTRKPKPMSFSPSNQSSSGFDNSGSQANIIQRQPYEKLTVDPVRKRSDSVSDSGFKNRTPQNSTGLKVHKTEQPQRFDKNAFQQNPFQKSAGFTTSQSAPDAHVFDKQTFRTGKKDELDHKRFSDPALKENGHRPGDRDKDRVTWSDKKISKDWESAYNHNRQDYDRYSHGDLRKLPPPGKSFYRELPQGHKKVHFKNDWFFIHDGCFYRRAYNGFVWVAPPIGFVLATLPFGYTTFYLGGIEYYSYAGVYYRSAPGGYVVINEPDELPPVWEVDAPPADFIIVNTEILNVRSGPASDFPVISEVYYGDKLPVIGTYHKWYYIRLPEGRKGWVNSYYVYPETTPEPQG